MDKPTKILTAVMIGFVLVLIATLPRPRGQARPVAIYADDRFPGGWQDSLNLPISRALVKSGVQGCGEYRYKESRARNGEYLVQCSRDGSTWRSYLVWPAIEKATGPVDENDLP